MSRRHSHEREQAFAEFKRLVKWIVVVAVLMVVGALCYLATDGKLTVSMVVATVLGVFFSVMLGCGLFAAAFFSEKSGHDQRVADATKLPTRRDSDGPLR